MSKTRTAGAKSAPAKYAIFNKTDGVFASPAEYDTPSEAARHIPELRERYGVQGYYLTSHGERISPDAIEYEVVELV